MFGKGVPSRTKQIKRNHPYKNETEFFGALGRIYCLGPVRKEMEHERGQPTPGLTFSLKTYSRKTSR